MNTWADVAAIIAEGPRLPGAACTMAPRTFDFDHDDETPGSRFARHCLAQAICEGCPALVACREWADGLATDSVTGVVGGRVYAPPSRFASRRKRKRVAA